MVAGVYRPTVTLGWGNHRHRTLTFQPSLISGAIRLLGAFDTQMHLEGSRSSKICHPGYLIRSREHRGSHHFHKDVWICLVCVTCQEFQLQKLEGYKGTRTIDEKPCLESS